MASVTHDGRSFMLDGRRIWLVSGTIPYARICRDHWKDRIHAAKQAGLNTVETPVFWNRHEPRPGKFDFKGENDLRHFVELVQQAGLYCILRIGPYVGDGWDMGGLPAWLLEPKEGVKEPREMRLRTANGPFLEASSRFITALAEQVRSLQVTAPGKGGPLLLIQAENQWTCAKEPLASEYLGELLRYIREAGLSCPVVNANNLWQSVEGEIDVWAGTEQMLGTMRQLAAVRPNQPRVVIDFCTGAGRVWGRPEPTPLDPHAVQRRLGEILAGGGQFNIRPFAGGSSFGFWGGRSPEGQDAYLCPSTEAGAMLDEAGHASGALPAVRRITHFASRFGRVLATLDPVYAPIGIDPESVEGHASGAKGGKGRDTDPGAGAVSVVHCTGTQGSVAFIFGDGGGKGPPRPVSLLLPDGSGMPVFMGAQSVAWCLFNVSVCGRSQIDYCNVNAFAAVGQAFVAFGPAGSRAMLSVNGSPVEVAIPAGVEPLVLEHEGLTLVLLSEEGIDRTFVTDGAVFVGVKGLTPTGDPVPMPGEKHYTRIDASGAHKRHTHEAPRQSHAGEKTVMSGWAWSPATEYQDGTSPRYAAIKGPADLGSLGCPHGYGWYRLTLPGAGARRAHLAFPEAGDRLHLFVDGEPGPVVGNGPGAARDGAVTIKKSTQNLVVLADNMGRYTGGAFLAERKGLFGHIVEHAPLKLGKPKIVRGAPMDVLSFASPLWEVREGDATIPDRLTWTIAHRKKTAIAVWFHNFPGRGLVCLHDKPIAYVDRAGPRCIQLDPEQVGRGNAQFQIALFGEHAEVSPEAAAEAVTFSEITGPFSAKAEFAFAKWEPPGATMYAPLPKSMPRNAGPAWFRCTFRVGSAHTPLFFEAAGLSKGQIYVNGHHIGRYFTATGEGERVGPQERFLLPDAWLHHGGAGSRENELVIFDEHGASPAKACVTH